MAWEVLLWVIFFIISMALIASNLYQARVLIFTSTACCLIRLYIVCLSDLEADYMNPYESSSRINAVVVPEMLLHGLCAALLLVNGYWFIFLLTLPITIYNSMLYVDAEKKYRIAKLALYLFIFLLVVIRSVVAGKFSNILEPFHPTNEDLDILSHVLEF